MNKIIPRQNLLSPSKYNLKSPVESSAETLDRIIVHNTANDTSAGNEISYMINNNISTSYHFAVDDKEVVQGLPLDRGGFSCANRFGDVHGIAIEICYSLSGGDRFIKAEDLTARFIAQLLNERNWGLDRVTKHQDYDGKYCPHRTLDMGWQRFLNIIKKYMEENINMTREDIQAMIVEEMNKRNPIYKFFDDIPKWAQSSVQKLIDAKVINGEGKDEKTGKIIYNLSNDMCRGIVLDDRK